MARHSFTWLAVVGLAALLPAEARGNPAIGPVTYDTVDAVEVLDNRITITGIAAGGSVPVELTFTILDVPGSTTGAAAARCDRLALLAMAKPGKYQFATTATNTSLRFGCKLIVRTP